MKRKTTRKPKPYRAISHVTRAARNHRNSPAPDEVNGSDAIYSLVTVSAQALRLSLDPAWHAGIALNLRLILKHASLVDEFRLPDDAEPAPVFRA